MQSCKLGTMNSVSTTWFAMLLSMAIGWSLDLPQEAFSKLKSPEFHEREVAQTELLAWSRAHLEPAMAEFFRQSRISDDPEVRERCLSILRILVTDEYSKQGEGYIGISLLDAVTTVPGDHAARNVIRVTQVQVGTPAQRADVRLNDLIVALDHDAWHEIDASRLFREKIRMMKPATRVTLKILRDNLLIDIEVTLGRRPLMADNPFFNGQNIDLQASERTAQEAYFRLWLSQRKIEK